MKIKELINKIENQKVRSNWSQGVNAYSVMLLEKLQEETDEISDGIDYRQLQKMLLNGAQNWSEYSWGGNALIYNRDIAYRLATPSELKRTRNGERKPNRREEWLDTQARALYQAFKKICETIEGTC